MGSIERMKKQLGLLFIGAAGWTTIAGCSSAPPADTAFVTTSTRGTVPPDLTAGAPDGSIKVILPSGPVWVDGANVYAEGCKTRGLTDATVTEQLKAANTSPPSNKTFNLICKTGTN
jgi:hypothetical protein